MLHICGEGFKTPFKFENHQNTILPSGCQSWLPSIIFVVFFVSWKIVCWLCRVECWRQEQAWLTQILGKNKEVVRHSFNCFFLRMLVCKVFELPPRSSKWPHTCLATKKNEQFKIINRLSHFVFFFAVYRVRVKVNIPKSDIYYWIFGKLIPELEP